MRKVLLPARGAEVLFDVRDKTVRLLESLFQVRISARGSQVSIEGEEDKERELESILSDFSGLIIEGCAFSNGDLRGAFQQISEGAAQSLRDFFPKKPILKTSLREVTPRSLNQSHYVNAIDHYDLVLGIGPAGTGKTYLAVAMAVSFLREKKVQRIVLARPAVEAGEKLGFLPGDMQEKVNPYFRPLSDALFHLLGGDRVQKLIDRGVIEIAPLAFMRGRTLSDSFIILDEAQNSTSEQMKMFLTRIGLNSKTVVTGDVTQIDLPAGQQSGLVEAQSILAGVEGISICGFDRKDVVRHPLVKSIIRAYEEKAVWKPRVPDRQ